MGSRPFFYPMHNEPVLRKYEKYNNYKFSMSEKLSEKGFYLPRGLGLSYSEIQKITEILKKIITFLEK